MVVASGRPVPADAGDGRGASTSTDGENFRALSRASAMSWATSKIALWPFLLSIILYSNSLEGQFVHDDIPAIVNNKDVSDSNIWNLLLNDFWGEPMRSPRSHKSYRPFTTLIFRCTYWLCEGRSECFHVLNVVLHACCTLLLQLTLNSFVQFKWAGIAAAVFAAHPVHTEAVSGVVGCADLMSALLTLIIVKCGSKFSGDIWQWPMLTVLAMLATFAKETGIMALPMVLVLHFVNYACSSKSSHYERLTTFLRRRSTRAILTMFALVLSSRLAAVALLCPKGRRLPLFQPQDNPTAFEPQLFTRVATFLYLPVRAFWQLLCPSLLSHDWQMGSVPPIRSLNDPRIASVLIFYSMLAKLITDALVKPDNEEKDIKALRMALVLLIMPYVLASNVLFYVGFVVAERILYLPSMGHCLLVSLGLRRLQRRFSWWPTLLALGLLVSSLGCKTIVRNWDWNSRETLSRSGLLALPNNAKMHYNFANCLKDQAKTEEAAIFYREAIRLWPSYSMAHNNLATVVNDSAEAEQHLRQALLLDPGHTTSLFNFAVILKQRGLCKEAVVFLERCVMQADAMLEAFALLRQLRTCKVELANNNSHIGDNDECDCNHQTNLSHRETMANLVELYRDDSKMSLMAELFALHFDDDPRPHLARASIAANLEQAKSHLERATIRLRHFDHNDKSILNKLWTKEKRLRAKFECFVDQNAERGAKKMQNYEDGGDFEMSRCSLASNCSDEQSDCDLH